MPSFQTYSFVDKTYKNHSLLAKNLQEGNNHLFEWKVIKLLLGLMDINYNIDSQVIKQDMNYGYIPSQKNTLITCNIITNPISPYTIKQLKSYLGSPIRFQNQAFYEDVANELAAYFHKKTISPLAAFLHIYRILERISYIFPLTYVSSAQNYTGTFTTLKNYFKNPESELGFFRVFLDDFLKTDVLFQSGNANFLFQHTYPDINEKQFKLLKRLIGSKIAAEAPYNSISIKYADLLELIITLRNRYFHFKSADVSNITQKEIIEEDIFFAMLNDTFLNWIAYIFFKIIAHNMSRM